MIDQIETYKRYLEEKYDISLEYEIKNIHVNFNFRYNNASSSISLKTIMLEFEGLLNEEPVLDLYMTQWTGFFKINCDKHYFETEQEFITSLKGIDKFDL